MQCGPPPYLLPEVVANSAAELAEMCWTTVNCIRSYISHRKNGTNGFTKNAERYVVVDIEEGEDE
jgi:hypothetical protein